MFQIQFINSDNLMFRLMYFFVNKKTIDRTPKHVFWHCSQFVFLFNINKKFTTLNRNMKLDDNDINGIDLQDGKYIK